MYDKKVALFVKDGLLVWQKLNEVSFLADGIYTEFPETHGEDFVTADKVRFHPFIKDPMLIYKADGTEKFIVR